MKVQFSHSVVSDSLRPMDCSPPGSSVLEIFQARILEWVAVSFSRGSSQPRDQTRVSCTAGRFFTNWATREVMSGECVISSVLSCRRKDLKRWSSVFCLFVLFYSDGINFQVVFGQSFWLRVLPSGTHNAQPRWMPARRILGGGRTRGVSFILSWILPVGGSLLVPCSLPGPPV